jgi:hypothetical protein
MAASLLKTLLSILLTFSIALPRLRALDVYTSAQLNRALADSERSGNSTVEYRLDREYNFNTRAFRLQIFGQATGNPAIIYAQPGQRHLRIDYEGMQLVAADVAFVEGGVYGTGLAGGSIYQVTQSSLGSSSRSVLPLRPPPPSAFVNDPMSERDGWCWCCCSATGLSWAVRSTRRAGG